MHFHNPLAWDYPPGLDIELSCQMEEQGIHQVATSTYGDTSFVEYKRITWAITDNGGELNVQKVNDDALPVSVAITSSTEPMPTDVVEYALLIVVRLLAVLNGKRVDYQWQS